jgi:hypothetical protein
MATAAGKEEKKLAHLHLRSFLNISRFFYPSVVPCIPFVIMFLVFVLLILLFYIAVGSEKTVFSELSKRFIVVLKADGSLPEK